MWSCGNDNGGQLCLGNKESQLKPQKTSFSNISRISAGWSHSLFQNDNGEIFSCGHNQQGQCGLGHFDYLQITPSFIPNLPPNIDNFVCGYEQNLFLDSEGNVYSVRNNKFSSLGLGHNTKQNVLNKIPNIPPIKIISCVGSSCYLIDFEENLWTFGLNNYDQQGLGGKTNINIPKVINTLKNIKQISNGPCGFHFIGKSLQNCPRIQQIINRKTNSSESISILKEINSQYSTIWRDEFYILAKSARK